MGNTQGILKFLKEEVNEKNIDEVISTFTQKLNEEGKDADYYEGEKRGYRLEISANHYYCGAFSSDQYFISENIKLGVMNGLACDAVYLQVNETKEAYRILIDKVKKSSISSFSDLVKIIYDTTVEYFGDLSEAGDKRVPYYEDIANNSDEDEEYPCGKISDFKGKNMAACVERAALSQNLMHFLGIESTYKASLIKDGEKKDCHAYNLVSYNEKYYIFDATIPRVEKDGSINPIVATIPKEAYETLINRYTKEDDYSVKTEYKSIRGKRKIHYNSFGNKVIDMSFSDFDEK